MPVPWEEPPGRARRGRGDVAGRGTAGAPTRAGTGSPNSGVRGVRGPRDSRWDRIPGSQRDKERAGRVLEPAPCRETGAGLGLLAPSGFCRSWERAGIRSSGTAAPRGAGRAPRAPATPACPLFPWNQGFPGMPGLPERSQRDPELSHPSRLDPGIRGALPEPPPLPPPSPGQGFPAMAPLPPASGRDPEPSHPSRLDPGTRGALPELPPGSVY